MGKGSGPLATDDQDRLENFPNRSEPNVELKIR
jgi:hypothetical protein